MIRQAHLNGKFNIYNKQTAVLPHQVQPTTSSQVNFESVVTDLDLRCQDYISSSLDALYPHAR